MVDINENNGKIVNSSKSKLSAEEIEEFKEREEEAEDGWEFKDLAQAIFIAGDQEWARKIYQQALDKAEDFREFMQIARSVVQEDGLSDQEWARKIYQQALDKAEGSRDFREIASSVAQEDDLNDKEWARKTYQQALDKAEDSNERKDIANSVAQEDDLNDKEWARKIYQQALDKAEGSRDFSDIAACVANQNFLNDKEWARKIYQQALDAAENVDDLIGLAEDIANGYSFGDKVWGREVYQLAINKSEKSEDIIRIANSVAEQSYLDDKKWRREILKMRDKELTMPINKTLIKEILSDNYDFDLIEFDDNGNFFYRFIVAEDFEVELKDDENIIDTVFALFPPEDPHTEEAEFCSKIVIDLIPKNSNKEKIENVVIQNSSIIKEIKKYAKISVTANEISFFRKNKYAFKTFFFGGFYSGKYRGYIHKRDLEDYAEERDIRLNNDITFDDLAELFRYIVFDNYEWNYYDDYSTDDNIYYILKD